MIAASLAAYGIVDAVAEPKPDPQRFGVRTLDVKARTISSFDRADFTRVTFGKLTFVGGLVLSCDEKSFGGWSGLALDPDGRGLLAVSDAGLWMRGALSYDAKGRPQGLEDVRAGPLKALDGAPLKRERDRDAEAVELVSGSVGKGELLIAFEQNHRIGRFFIGSEGVGAPKSYVRPDRSQGRMSNLKGFEAMTKLKAGRYRGSILAIAERKHDGKGRHSGWIFKGRKALRFALTDIGGYDITGVASLPDGDLIVLERRFRWLEGVRMRLRRVPLEDLRPGATIAGEVLMEATMAQDIDNMEGIAVHRDRMGRAIVTILSDDNFNRLFQRTILLQFRMPERDGRSVEAR